MRNYTFELTISEKSDEFWENLKGTGCDEVEEMINDALVMRGLFVGHDYKIKLRCFSDD